MERLTVTKLSQISGLCTKTIQKYADMGKLPHRRDTNNWRIFDAESVEIARRLAGLKKDKEPESNA
ncbi:MerR family transcriptional regulator [bacterium]|nr:MerR family transcriptional regulator [bacterium]